MELAVKQVGVAVNDRMIIMISQSAMRLRRYLFAVATRAKADIQPANSA